MLYNADALLVRGFQFDTEKKIDHPIILADKLDGYRKLPNCQKQITEAIIETAETSSHNTQQKLHLAKNNVLACSCPIAFPAPAL